MGPDLSAVFTFTSHDGSPIYSTANFLKPQYLVVLPSLSHYY
jgi:hypothetical protein